MGDPQRLTFGGSEDGSLTIVDLFFFDHCRPFVLFDIFYRC